MTDIIGYYKPATRSGLEVIFQDESMLILNKPNGLLSVPGNGEENKDCLAARAQIEFPDALTVHRLDMATSGIMIMARGKQMQRELSKTFASREIYKKYIAIVDGRLNHAFGSIDLPLIKDWPNRPKQKICYETGKPSLSHYKVLHYDAETHTTRLELTPETGRSHQLRVHLQQLGHAIVGDRLYATEQGQQKSPRLMLHAQSLAFKHPTTGEQVYFESEPGF